MLLNAKFLIKFIFLYVSTNHLESESTLLFSCMIRQELIMDLHFTPALAFVYMGYHRRYSWNKCLQSNLKISFVFDCCKSKLNFLAIVVGYFLLYEDFWVTTCHLELWNLAITRGWNSMSLSSRYRVDFVVRESTIRRLCLFLIRNWYEGFAGHFIIRINGI